LPLQTSAEPRSKLLEHSTTRMVEIVYGHLSTNEYKTAIADLPDLNRGSTVSLQEGPAGGA